MALWWSLDASPGSDVELSDSDCQVQIFRLRSPPQDCEESTFGSGMVWCRAPRVCTWSWGPPRGRTPLGSSEERGGEQGQCIKRQRAQRAGVLPREVANCALIIAGRAGKGSAHTEQDSPLRIGPRSVGPRHAPQAGWLRSSPPFFFICDICSLLVPPVIPYPSQLCRPPALRWCMECPEHTAFLMCDKTEPSHGGMASEGIRISINLL